MLLNLRYLRKTKDNTGRIAYILLAVQVLPKRQCWVDDAQLKRAARWKIDETVGL